MESPRRITPPTRNAAQHAAPPPRSLRSPGRMPPIYAGVKYRTHFKTAFADAELPGQSSRLFHVQAIGCNVLADNSGRGPWPQGLAIHEQDLALAPGRAWAQPSKPVPPTARTSESSSIGRCFFRSAGKDLALAHVL